MYTLKIGTLICVISFKCVISVFILCTFQATILCDIVVLYVVKKRDVYKSMKYQSVADESVNVSSAFFFPHLCLNKVITLFCKFFCIDR